MPRARSLKWSLSKSRDPPPPAGPPEQESSFINWPCPETLILLNLCDTVVAEQCYTWFDDQGSGIPTSVSQCNNVAPSPTTATPYPHVTEPSVTPTPTYPPVTEPAAPQTGAPSPTAPAANQPGVDPYISGDDGGGSWLPFTIGASVFGAVMLRESCRAAARSAGNVLLMG